MNENERYTNTYHGVYLGSQVQYKLIIKSRSVWQNKHVTQVTQIYEGENENIPLIKECCMM